MIREQLTAPSPQNLAAFLNRYTRTRDCLIQVAGLAEMTYLARAASTADLGTYLVLIKHDGSLQIHHPTGIKPMNWQPKTDRIMAEVAEDVCMLLASWRSPEELVQVMFLEPQVALALELAQAGGFVLKGSEAQMQQALADHPELIEAGLRVLNRELMVESGGIDLYAQDAQVRYVVVELKRGRATQHAVSQLARYVRSVQQTLGKSGDRAGHSGRAVHHGARAPGTGEPWAGIPRDLRAPRACGQCPVCDRAGLLV